MIRWRHLRRVLIALLVAATAGCAAPLEAPGDVDPDGLGGTGVHAGTDPEGLGGTGIRGEDPDGLGGTGVHASTDPDGLGGTGIVGEITALGSIRVNGLWIRVPEASAIDINGRRAATTALQPGRIVEVLADSEGDELVAREVRVRDALVGPIQSLQRERRRLRILGQWLSLPDEVDLDAMTPGRRVAVSGLWRASGELDVTRVAFAGAPGVDAVYGPLVVARSGELRVGGTRLLSAGTPPPGQLAAGRYVLATGRARGDDLTAAQIRAQPPQPFAGRAATLVIEGYPGVGVLAASSAESPHVAAALRRAERDGARVRITATLREGRAVVRDLTPVRSVPTLLPGSPLGVLSPALGSPAQHGTAASATVVTPVPTTPTRIPEADAVSTLPTRGRVVETPSDALVRPRPAPTTDVAPRPRTNLDARPVAVQRTLVVETPPTPTR